jgi:uncharacterized damage-inducible protein DinB
MRIGIGLSGALAAVVWLASPAVAQEHTPEHEAEHQEHMSMEMPSEGIRADLIGDIVELEEKYVSLAEAMADHWAWRPGEGVRSVGEVFGHVTAANMMIPTLFGMETPSEFQGESPQETMGNLQALEKASAEELMEHLKHSFMHARHVVARVDEERLDEAVQYFGQEGPLREVLLLLVTHMHEHLGQSIAYARTNGVVPPWSAGGM